jgi:hypothetical protein
MITREQKETRVARARAHLDNNRLQPGSWLGGSVACDAVDILGRERAAEAGSDPDSFYAIVAAQDGTAEWLEHLRDMVVENWPDDRRLHWHLAFADALPVGRDLNPIYHRICLRLLRIASSFSDTWPALSRAATVGLIDRVSDLHGRQEHDDAVWQDARSLGESVWLMAEAAGKEAFDDAGQGEKRMTAGECAAESALFAARGAAWSAWTPVHDAPAPFPCDTTEMQSGGYFTWGASRCAHDAVWSAGMGAVARSQKPVSWPLELPAWSDVAQLILRELSR